MKKNNFYPLWSLILFTLNLLLLIILLNCLFSEIPILDEWFYENFGNYDTGLIWIASISFIVSLTHIGLLYFFYKGKINFQRNKFFILISVFAFVNLIIIIFIYMIISAMQYPIFG